MTSTPTRPQQAARRRASRAAGPANGKSAETMAVRIETPASGSATPARTSLKPAAPARRPANRRLVAIIALAFGFVATALLGAAVSLMVVQKNHTEAVQARNQRFVDTATQTVMNMFSFKQDNIDDSVNRLYNNTSGPLRDMLGQNNNVENLKAIFRDTGGSSEAVILGAALEGIDGISDNASVLVSARVTASDMNGNNRPSQPYRLRIVVHEGDDGRMTAYDLKYPNGGN
ncbi:mammalian cell entry protein [Mycobacterium sp. MMS18-G62]